MSITVNRDVLEQTTHPTLRKAFERASSWRNEDATIPDREITDEVVQDLVTAAGAAGDAKLARVASAILLARQGDFNKAIPSLHAAPEVIKAFLRHEMVDGWVYKSSVDGHLYPYLVTDVCIKRATHPQDKDSLSIELAYASPLPARGGARRGYGTTSVHLDPADVSRRKVSAVLEAAGLTVETPELRAAYDESVEKYRKVLTTGFAQQFRYSGQPTTDSWKTPNEVKNHKVIHDLHPNEVTSFGEAAPSHLFDTPDSDESDGMGELPVHTTLPVFDLATHEFYTVHTDDLTEYVYDSSLREKIILPQDQKDLLDILTTDLGTFASDLIEGKSAGSTILCKGQPGVGKTLTAEVYAEIIKRPLYSIHSGNLGTQADNIRANLEEVFKRSKRWNAVLLLDEADVFVLERSNNIAQNAVVAEFLRTLEYFDGLLFMTTNRADSIDEAIISRCVAIIDYRAPERDDARVIWRVLAEALGVEIEDSLIEELLDGFPNIVPRDIKMLLALAARVARSKKEPLSADLFAKCAMFRGKHFETHGTSD